MACMFQMVGNAAGAYSEECVNLGVSLLAYFHNILDLARVADLQQQQKKTLSDLSRP
jgi:hypothetical protein